APPPPAGFPPFDLQPLIEVLWLGMTREASRATLGRLRQPVSAIQRFLERLNSRPSLRTRCEEWLQQAIPWVEALGEFDEGLQSVKGLAERVHNLFVGRISNEQGRAKPRPLVFRLGPGLRPLLGEVKAEEAVERLRRVLESVQPLQTQLAQRWR